VRKYRTRFPLLFALSCSGIMLLAPCAGAVEFEPPLVYRIKDGPAQRVIGIRDGVLFYTAVTSTAGREVRQIQGPEFKLRLLSGWLTPRDFIVTNVTRQGPGSLEVELGCEKAPLSVTLHYRQEPGSAYIRRWLTIKPAPGEHIFLDRVVLESFRPWQEPRTFPGHGQPVYVGDTFWSVAWPSSSNSVRSGRVVCEYLVGLRRTRRVGSLFRGLFFPRPGPGLPPWSPGGPVDPVPKMKKPGFSRMMAPGPYSCGSAR